MFLAKMEMFIMKSLFLIPCDLKFNCLKQSFSKCFHFLSDGGLSDFLPGPIKELNQTGSLTAGIDVLLPLV